MAHHLTTLSRYGMVATAALAAVALAACGDDDGGTTATPAQTGTAPQTTATPAQTGTAPQTATTPAQTGTTPETTTTPPGAASSEFAIVAEESGGLAWNRRTLTARPGEVTIALDNPNGNQLPHAVEIEGGGVQEESETIDPGAKTSVTANLRAGTYVYYCPVDAHRQQGMEGTLTVR